MDVHFDSRPEISGKCSLEIRKEKGQGFLYGYLQLVKLQDFCMLKSSGLLAVPQRHVFLLMMDL